ncbi:MAG: ABC transporter permease [Bacteroidota bacterium]
MFRNYLKVALRNGIKNKLVTFINVSSLALGIAACLLIFLFIKDERSFDTFHQQHTQIYRINEIQSFPGTNTQKVALSMAGMGPNMTKDYPEILNYTRFWSWGSQLFHKGDQRLMIERTVMVDSTFLHIFDYQLIQGDRQTALEEPNTIVISQDIAQRFFANNDPMGELLRLDDNEYKVTGVIENAPENIVS